MDAVLPGSKALADATVLAAASTLRAGLDGVIAGVREALEDDELEAREAALRSVLALADTLNGTVNALLAGVAPAAPSGGGASLLSACHEALARAGNLGASAGLAILLDHQATRDRVACEEHALVLALANLLRRAEHRAGQGAALFVEVRDAAAAERVRVTIEIGGGVQDQGSPPAVGDGLEFVRSFATVLGGSLTVRTGPEALVLELPATAEAAAARSRGRALVVDDQPHVRQQLARYLEDLGLEVETADRGAAALQSLAARPVDVVFLDLVLPDLPGVEVLRRLRALYAALPIVVVSGLDDEAAALAAGATAYLPKPVWRARFDAAVRALDLHPQAGDADGT